MIMMDISGMIERREDKPRVAERDALKREWFASHSSSVIIPC